MHIANAHTRWRLSVQQIITRTQCPHYTTVWRTPGLDASQSIKGTRSVPNITTPHPRSLAERNSARRRICLPLSACDAISKVVSIKLAAASGADCRCHRWPRARASSSAKATGATCPGVHTSQSACAASTRRGWQHAQLRKYRGCHDARAWHAASDGRSATRTLARPPNAPASAASQSSLGEQTAWLRSNSACAAFATAYPTAMPGHFPLKTVTARTSCAPGARKADQPGKITHESPSSHSSRAATSIPKSREAARSGSESWNGSGSMPSRSGPSRRESQRAQCSR
mmetsp:Transcript_13749/g.43929  ORF Transcript_13749/g.43929 Transcript_13749/m.43929 type:complete len:286 (+) Transcript_13749:1662-2519(+)